ncbi:MAG TPA: hypothetical protein VJQ55_16025 [Candidatus Binatia bacterium]|nr:hypothetical protein [Candidatus Binatia bacterium]
MMANAVTQVLTTVNAPYGAAVSAHQLAAMIIDSQSAIDFNASVFAFFSEVPLQVQKQFMSAMNVNEQLASQVAEQVSQLSGYALPLAA